MRILIADDDEVLRELLEALLVRNGHEVITAENGDAALRAYINRDADFDYVITDYQMPRMNGVVLIMEIRRREPGQKVILVSGDPPQMTDIIRKEAGEFPVLRKPYGREDLLTLLK